MAQPGPDREREQAPWSPAAAAASYGGDEEFGASSGSEIDTDLTDIDDDEDEDDYPIPSHHAAGAAAADADATGARDEAAPGAPGSSGLANLAGRLHCENVELREALQEARREADRANRALDAERGENCRLLAELEKVRQSQGGAACEPGSEKGGAEGRPGVNIGEANDSLQGIVERIKSLKVEAQDEREQRLSLEQELVRSKIRCAEASDRVEVLESILEKHSLELDGSPGAVEQSASEKSLGKKGKKGPIKKLVGRMFKPHGSHSHSEPERIMKSDSKDDIVSQTEVVKALMTELKRVRKKAKKIKAKAGKHREKKDTPAIAAA